MDENSNNHEVQQLLLKAEQLGKILGISKRQVFRLRNSGKLPKPINIGGSVRWRKDEIEAWIEAGAPELRVWEAMRKH